MKSWFQVALLALGLCSVTALAGPDSFDVGSGRDGPLTVTAAGTVINRHAQVTGPIAPGENVLLVAGTEGFEAGDLVMVLQVTGLVPEPSPGLTGPVELSRDAVGQWELARLAAVGEGALTVSSPLMYSYAAQVTQVIRVPEYTHVWIQRGASLRAVPWDGGTGGVVAFLATGTVHNEGEISATGAGFRGGRYVPDSSNPVACSSMDVGARPGAQKGEGVAVTQYGPTKTGREMVSNGGGGGVCPMAGGGGGGNGGAGGHGGSVADTGDTGGQGGGKLVYSLRDHLSFGGGGGSGHGEGWSGPDGGAGGGAIFIRASRLTGTGFILADGDPGGSSSLGGAGGGGAGGSIHVRLSGDAGCGGVDARGGVGGNAAGIMSQAGEGGGGGGGRTLFRTGSTSGCPISVAAGSNGSRTFLHTGVLSHPDDGLVEAPTVDAGLATITASITKPADGSTVSNIGGPPIVVCVTTADGGCGGGPYNYDLSINGKSHLSTTSSVSPWTYTPSPSLPGGTYTVYVKATEVPMGPGTPPSYTSRSISFTVDATAPDTSIKANPPPVTTDKSATFEFLSTEEGGSFKCSFVPGTTGGGTFESCTSPQTYVVPGDGTYTFSVQAVDAVGNVDPTPATYTWTVLSLNTTIDNAPPLHTNSTSASFQFSSVGGISYECALTPGSSGGGTFSACTSPKGYTDLIPDGPYTFSVRAINALGIADPTPATHTWTVDTVPPDTSISSAPLELTHLTTASFRFSSTEADGRYECALAPGTSGGGTFATCISPKDYSSLGDGTYTFSVRHVDAAGNEDSIPARHTWTVDATAPNARIDANPSSNTNSTSASFQFSSTGGGVRYECALAPGSSGGGTFADCASPKGYTTLGDGTYTFSVRAFDEVGNESTPATYTWTVDTVPPETRISSAPPTVTNSASATFGFSSPGGVRYECALDAPGTSRDAPFAACSSPKAQMDLEDGLHIFSVRAIDAAGNVETPPATHTWTVDTTGPDARIDSGPPPQTREMTAVFRFSSGEASATFECSLDASSFTSCSSPKSFSGLTESPHAFSVRAVDVAGNRGSTARYNWNVDTTPPRVQVLSPADGDIVSTRTPIIIGTVEGPFSTVKVLIDEVLAGEALADKDGYWSFPTTAELSNGSHTVKAKGIDPAGNEGVLSASNHFTVDTEPPETEIISAPPKSSNSRLAAFEFGSPNGATEFDCRLDAARSFTACAVTHVFSKLADGEHTLQVRARDNAGNVDPTPAIYQWTVVIHPPPFPEVVEPADGATVNTGTPAVTGRAVPNSTVTIYIDDKKSGVAQADESGNWTFRPPTPLEAGEHKLTTETTDEAGNTSAQRSDERVFTIVISVGEARAIGGGLNCASSGANPASAWGLLGGGLWLAWCRRRRVAVGDLRGRRSKVSSS